MLNSLVLNRYSVHIFKNKLLNEGRKGERRKGGKKEERKNQRIELFSVLTVYLFSVLTIQ